MYSNYFVIPFIVALTQYARSGWCSNQFWRSIGLGHSRICNLISAVLGGCWNVKENFCKSFTLSLYPSIKNIPIDVRDAACKYVPKEAPEDVVPAVSFDEEIPGTLLDVTLMAVKESTRQNKVFFFKLITPWHCLLLEAEDPMAVVVEIVGCGKTFATGTVAEGGACVVTR